LIRGNEQRARMPLLAFRADGAALDPHDAIDKTQAGDAIDKDISHLKLRYVVGPKQAAGNRGSPAQVSLSRLRMAPGSVIVIRHGRTGYLRDGTRARSG
jgi:hypothetical protein